jgi:FtsP/CotA-like multicopper oxidase with cupredoxin domain
MEEPISAFACSKIEKSGLVYKPKTLRYDLYISDTIVNYTGKSKHAIAINGSIPAPTLTFAEGDTAEIYVHNMLEEETSVHWHGRPTNTIPFCNIMYRNAASGCKHTCRVKLTIINSKCVN